MKNFTATLEILIDNYKKVLFNLQQSNDVYIYTNLDIDDDALPYGD